MLNKDKAICNAIELLFIKNKRYGELVYNNKTYSFLIEKSYRIIKLHLYKIILIGFSESDEIRQIQFSVQLKNNELIYLDASDFHMIQRRIPENQNLLYNILYKFIDFEFLEGLLK